MGLRGPSPEKVPQVGPEVPVQDRPYLYPYPYPSGSLSLRTCQVLASIAW